jgi:hypothetical protein
LLAQSGSVLARVDRHGVQLATLVQLQALLLQGAQRIAPRQHTELRPCTRIQTRQMHAQPAANGACANDGDFVEGHIVHCFAHARHPVFCLSI